MTVQTVADKRLHPGTMALRWLAEAPQTIIGLPVIFGVTSDVGIGWTLFIMFGFAMITLFIAAIRWHRFQYGVGANEIVIESGLISRNRRTIPFSRIQDVDIERKLLHRVFGLAKVRVETGAGGKDEGSLDSVSMGEADNIRAAVRAAKQGITPVDTPEEVDAVLFEMPIGRVLRYGLFSYSFGSLAAILGGLGYLYSQFDELLGDPEVIYKRAQTAAPSEFQSHWVAYGLISLLVLAMLTSVCKVLLSDFGFHLTKDDRGLRRMRGLFTRTEILIPKKRVQLGLITSNPVWSRVGQEGLALQTLGGGEGASGHQVVAPFATRVEIEPILAEIPALRLPGPESFQHVSPRHKWRTIIEFPFIIALGIGLSFVNVWALLAIMPFIFIIPGQWMDAARHSYAVSDDMLFVQSGFWRRKLWLVPIGHAETVSIRRGWIQRKWGLATVLVDTAGATALADPRIVDLDADVAKGLAATLVAIARQERGHRHANPGRRIPDPPNT